MRGLQTRTRVRSDVTNGAMCFTNGAPRKTADSRRILDAVGSVRRRMPTPRGSESLSAVRYSELSRTHAYNNL